MSKRPSPPWGSFPLTELTLLAALGLALATLLSWGSERALWAGGGCVALGVLAGFEVSLREHFGGYRRHSALLAFTVAVAAALAVFFAGSPGTALAPVAAVAFGLAFAGFERAAR